LTKKKKMVRCNLVFLLLFLGLAQGLLEAPMVRYWARVAYDGQHFCGFQLQPATSHNKKTHHRRTVQGDLEAVLNQRYGYGNHSRVIKVVAASRTDAGVHARGQAVHWDVPATVASHADDAFLRDLCYSLNRMLRPNVRVWNIQRVPGMVRKPVPSQLRETDDEAVEMGDFLWNVLFDATGKRYSYRLSLASVLHPLQRAHRWHPPWAETVNVTTLARVLRMYVGTHDFRAFCGGVERTEQATQRRLSTVRTIYTIDLVREDEEGDDNYRIDFHIKGALYKQIRNLVGTALDVSRGILTEDDVVQLLQPGHGRRDNPSRPAPPEGLTLEKVEFVGDDDDGVPEGFVPTDSQSVSSSVRLEIY
jgi:tRNA pseudouridine38-40 synthase